MARRVLITGASGFVGGHLLPLVAEADTHVEAWTRDPVDGDPRARWTVLDMADRRAVRDAIGVARPDEVYHLAGAAHVGQSFGSVTSTLETNVLGTAHLLDALREVGCNARILMTCSSTVYRSAGGPLDEDSPLGPVSPYALSKLAQERLALRSHAEDGQQTIVIRAFNHVGPGQTPTFFAPAFARQVAEIEAGLREPLLRVGNLEARRDLTDVRDVVRAYRLLMQRGAAGAVYNVCSGAAHAIGDVLAMLVAHAGTTVDVVVDAALLRPNDTPVVLGSYARLHAATGWTPSIPIARTLADLLADWRTRVGRAS